MSFKSFWKWAVLAGFIALVGIGSHAQGTFTTILEIQGTAEADGSVVLELREADGITIIRSVTVTVASGATGAQVAEALEVALTQPTAPEGLQVERTEARLKITSNREIRLFAGAGAEILNEIRSDAPVSFNGLTFALVVPTPPTPPPPIAWAAPVVIAEAGFKSGDLVYNSDLAVAPDGTAYVVWADLTADVFLSIVPPGETLQPGEPINVSAGAGGDWPVAPAISLGGGRLCIAWEGWDDLGGDIFVRCSADGGRSWLSDPVKVAETDTPSGQGELQGEWDGYLDVFVDAQGTVYVAWVEDFIKLVWSKSTDGTSFAPFQVLLELIDSPRWPHWAGDAQGNLHLAYNESIIEGGNVYFFKTSDGGATWVGPTQVTNNPGFSDAPEWAIIGQTIYNVNDDTTEAAEDSADIMLTVSQDSGQTWAQSRVIAKDGGFPSIATDGKNLYVSFSSTVEPEQTGFVCSTDGGATWKRDDIPDSGPNFVFLGLRGPGIDASETAIAVDAQGSVYVAWARGSRQLGLSQIMLAKRPGC